MEPGRCRQSPAEVAQTVNTVDHPNLVALIDFSHAYIGSRSAHRGLNFREQLRAMPPVAGPFMSMIPSVAHRVLIKATCRRRMQR